MSRSGITDRIQRAVAERIYVVSSANQVYRVMGSRGTVYRVNLNESSWVASRCSCPDFSRRHQLCKHIFYILLRVQHLSSDEVVKGCLSTKSIPLPEIQEVSGQDCAICYDVITPEEKVKWCEECNKPFHESCSKVWKTHCIKRRIPVTCPLCRYRLVL